MTRFGSCSMGLLGLGRWKLWISIWKVTVDEDYFNIASTLLTPFSLKRCTDIDAVTDPLLKQACFFARWQMRNIIMWLFKFYNNICANSWKRKKQCLCKLSTYMFVLQCLIAEQFGQQCSWKASLTLACQPRSLLIVSFPCCYCFFNQFTVEVCLGAQKGNVFSHSLFWLFFLSLRS